MSEAGCVVAEIKLADGLTYKISVDKMRPGRDWVWFSDLPARFFSSDYRKSATLYGEMFVMGPFVSKQQAITDASKFFLDRCSPPSANASAE
jgi:hypothetical protein